MAASYTTAQPPVINLHVVTRYYWVVTCSYNEIHILMIPCITQHFAIQVGNYGYRETFRCGLTADSRLHIAMDCGRDLWSNSEYRSKFHDPHTSVDRTRRRRGNGIASLAYILYCWPPMKLSRAAAVFIVSLNREDVECAKYK